MNNTGLLKIYLISAFVSVMLFLLSFAIGWNTLDNMKDMYGATLPFLFTAVLSLAAFGLTPEVKAVKGEAKDCDNVIDIRSASRQRTGRTVSRLRKIS